MEKELFTVGCSRFLDRPDEFQVQDTEGPRRLQRVSQDRARKEMPAVVE